MQVHELRSYGLAFSDAESRWPPELVRKMAREGKAVLFGALGFWEKVRFGLAFLTARRRAARLDLSDLRARGMTNEVFLAQQLEYLAMFAALSRVVGTERAVEIGKAIMERTAHEPMLLCLPEAEQVRQVGEPIAVFREYFRAGPQVNRAAGCHELTAIEDRDDAAGFDVTWCVWLELARRMGVPAACIPNCYADDLVFPDYFRSLGLRYRRTGTLALGAARCDFRLERIRDAS